ncbi:MAG TPA: MlaD family protein [Gemmatimonadales bacterium]|nr:MlaD family protein [Gemmatimonadales bacterium]
MGRHRWDVSEQGVMDERQQELRRIRRQRLVTSALVLLLIVVGVVYSYRGQIQAALARGPEFTAAFTTIGGLRVGDEVRYGGIPVGRVRKVEIDPRDPTHILIVFRVRERTPMRVDTRASVIDATNSVTRYLSLRPGSKDAPPLPPGQSVQTEVGPTLEETLTRLTDLLGRFDTLLTAAAPLTHGDFFGRLDSTTAHLDQLTSLAARAIGRAEPKLSRSLDQLGALTDHSTHLVARLDSVSPQLAAATVAALGALEDTRALLAELRAGGLEGGGLATMVQNLSVATDNLARLTNQLERAPLSVLHGRRTPEKSAGPPVRE